ncbi:MAG: 50S ribosomal protein L6 [Candidatus Latescibacteria bacterium 4484_7]|nr:MAG: 50S ribosomal protein L6 [Candidatus Latescibacteria bacterium 4484_7]RKZ09130.1 MAG: 50S ribosomal protein L6 [bacterium]
MSRVGKNPVPIPSGVTVELKNNVIRVKGPKGELEQILHPDMIVEVGESEVVVKRPTESKTHKSLHGLSRTLIANMVEGVSKGFVKDLEIEGVEYRAEMKGKTLVMALGYSHPVVYEPREGITIEVPEPKKIKIIGIDKQKVGQTAAEIRGFRPPEPYKGKGIRYAGEQVRRKAGKAAVGTGF